MLFSTIYFINEHITCQCRNIFCTILFVTEATWKLAIRNANTGVLQSEENLPLVLNCSVNSTSGTPNASIMWHNGSILLGKGGPVMFAFKIVPQRYDHEKTYTCTATNNKTGEGVHKSIKLDILCKYVM